MNYGGSNSLLVQIEIDNSTVKSVKVFIEDLSFLDWGVR